MPATTVNSLPNELLLSVFESVYGLEDSSSAYSTLLSTAQVCRRWGSAAAKVLLSNVEITRREDALRLIQLLESSASTTADERDQPYVESLTVGLGGCNEPQLLDDQLFLRLLSLTPRIRKLNILHQNSLPCLPTQLPSLPFLSYVTIAPAGGAPAAMAETTLIQQLPSSVRFLNLPATERTRFVEPAKEACPPAFQLYGLECQDFPSPSTNWVLGNSAESLQSISAVYFSKLAAAAESHPNIRSVRVLGRLSNQAAKEGFSKFERLERVEIRDLSAQPALLDTLPSTARYIRFWATPLAGKLTQLVASGRFPDLKTVVWDHFTPAMKGPAAERMGAVMQQMKNKLQEVCDLHGVRLKMAERKDGGLRAGLVSLLLFFPLDLSLLLTLPFLSSRAKTTLTKPPSTTHASNSKTNPSLPLPPSLRFPNSRLECSATCSATKSKSGPTSTPSLRLWTALLANGLLSGKTSSRDTASGWNRLSLV